MSTFMCIVIHMLYVCICICIGICISACIVRVFVFACCYKAVHVCLYVCLHVHLICLYLYSWPCMKVNKCAFIHIHVYVHVYIHIYIYTHMPCLYTYTHICTHACCVVCGPWFEEVADLVQDRRLQGLLECSRDQQQSFGPALLQALQKFHGGFEKRSYKNGGFWLVILCM